MGRGVEGVATPYTVASRYDGKRAAIGRGPAFEQCNKMRRGKHQRTPQTAKAPDCAEAPCIRASSATARTEGQALSRALEA